MSHENKFLPNSPTHATDIEHAFLSLSDTPSTYVGGKYLKATSSGVDLINIHDDGYYTSEQADCIHTTLSGCLQSQIDDMGYTSHCKDIHVVFGGKKEKYWEFSNKSYVVARCFYFVGTQIIGTPTSIKVIAHMYESATGTLQIYDYTNNTIVSEINFTNTDLQVLTCNSLSNLPPSEAILQIRAKTSSNNKKGYVCSVTLCF